MATEEEVKNKTDGDDEADTAAPEAESRQASSDEVPEAEFDEAMAAAPAADGGEDTPMPAQLGHRRFVYAAYLAGGIVVAFVVDKILGYGWYKLHEWKPEQLPEPQDEATVAIAAIIAIGVTLYYWNRTRARTLAEEVAEELTKVTWPTRQDVTNSTTVVVLTTLFATVFFALMDQFWLWVTKHVYGS